MKIILKTFWVIEKVQSRTSGSVESSNKKKRKKTCIFVHGHMETSTVLVH